MPKIRLNKRGKELFPHLADRLLTVYGYSNDHYSFVVWDAICQKWVHITETLCEGVDEYD